MGSGVQTETCGNCGGIIGALETPMIWGESVVCHDCYAKLSSQAKPIAPPVLQSSGRSILVVIMVATVVTALACVGGYFLYARHTGESTYQGKSLSEWIVLERDEDANTSAQATEALSHFYDPSDCRRIAAAFRHPNNFNEAITLYRTTDSDDDRNNAASLMGRVLLLISKDGPLSVEEIREFEYLSPPPKQLLPVLEQILAGDAKKTDDSERLDPDEKQELTDAIRQLKSAK